MIESDLSAFSEVCKDLMRVFPKRLEEFERAQMHRDYFKALRRFPIRQVQAGADAWMQRGKFFPKPAEWIDAIPRQTVRTTEVPALTEADGRALRHAESLRYEDAPCSCRECLAADVSEKPRRFVPDLSADGTEQHALDGDKVVTTGHWAHGHELARWYEARADFWNRCHELGLTTVAKDFLKFGKRLVDGKLAQSGEER